MNKQEMYTKLVALCENIELKGKKNLYTSVNGHMFSQLNNEEELGIRFSKEVQEKYMVELNTTYFKSYGAIMKGYILIPEQLWSDLDSIAQLLNESYTYILTLQPK